MSTKPKNELTETKIYVLKEPDSLDIRYVGKTVNSLLSRLGSHISDAKNQNINNHRVNWLRKLINGGKLPVIEEIDKCPWNESQGLETYYISYYKNLGCNLVNETEGGEGTLGNKQSQETVQKRKDSLRKELPKVYQYDLTGKLIKEWDNAPLAAETLGLKSSGITRCLRGDRYKYKNYIWKYDLVDNASEDLEKNQQERYILNKTKSVSKPQCLLGKIISQESKLIETPYIYVYDLDYNLLYEGISQSDICDFINEHLERPNIDIHGRITSCIKNNTPYYNTYYFSHQPPLNYKNIKNKNLLIISDGQNTYNGIQEASDKLGVKKANIINNLKGKTKVLTINKEHKVKLTWTLNKEHCRLYVKTYRLSVDELEEQAKQELNIELTN